MEPIVVCPPRCSDAPRLRIKYEALYRTFSWGGRGKLWFRESRPLLLQGFNRRCLKFSRKLMTNDL